MDLGQARKLFIMAKQQEGVSAATEYRYNTDLKRFLKFVLEEKQIFDVSEIKAGTIREYFVSLKETGMKNVTLHIHFRILRTFFLFLHREDTIADNPMKTIKAPKKEQKPMRTFTAQEITKIVNAFDKDTFAGFRNYTIMLTFFGTGIRKGELTNLTTADINITNDQIRVSNGKGNKTRYVPIGKTLRRTLKQYLQKRAEFLDDGSCSFLFVSQYKKQLKVSSISAIFKDLKKELGLTGERISAHSWRHTFAKLWLLNNGDIFTLQEILGHADISTTKGYLHLNDKEIKMQNQKYNPLDNTDWLY